MKTKKQSSALPFTATLIGAALVVSVASVLSGVLPAQLTPQCPNVGNVIDDGDCGHRWNAGGVWSPNPQPHGYKGDQWFALPQPQAPDSISIWKFEGLDQGSYEVFVTWAARPESVQVATNAPYTVRDGAKVLQTVRVNQKIGPGEQGGISYDDRKWISIGTYEIKSGTLQVNLRNLADGQVIADAVQVQNVGPRLSFLYSDPVQKTAHPAAKNVSLGVLELLSYKGGPVVIDEAYFALYALNRNAEPLHKSNKSHSDDIREVVENVRLRNLDTNQIYPATLLTGRGKSGQQEAGTYQMYRVGGMTTSEDGVLHSYEILVDFVQNPNSSSLTWGDSLRAQFCRKYHSDWGCQLHIHNSGESLEYNLKARSLLSGIPIANVSPEDTLETREVMLERGL